jgi:hypothetical protein
LVTEQQDPGPACKSLGIPDAGQQPLLLSGFNQAGQVVYREQQHRIQVSRQARPAQQAGSYAADDNTLPMKPVNQALQSR